MNTEGQEMETYQIFVVLMGNSKITEKIDFQAPKDLVAPSNKIKKSRHDFDDKKIT